MSRPPLARLRARARELASSRALRDFAAGLSDDPRVGAREVAGRCLRRAVAIDAEAERMARLFALRDRLVREGAHCVAGVDEVGVGPLAGPVVAAAVVLPARPRLDGLDDSKKLTRKRREALADAIHAQAIEIGIGEVSPSEIDALNIYRAALEAMRRAVAALPVGPDQLLVDARRIPGVAAEQTAIVGGDGKDASIAAASIVAKVHRDAIMRRLDAEFPAYGFGAHKGYGTPQHLAALRRAGASPVHRRSFAPVAHVPVARPPVSGR